MYDENVIIGIGIGIVTFSTIVRSSYCGVLALVKIKHVGRNQAHFSPSSAMDLIYEFHLRFAVSFRPNRHSRQGVSFRVQPSISTEEVFSVTMKCFSLIFVGIKVSSSSVEPCELGQRVNELQNPYFLDFWTCTHEPSHRLHILIT